MIALRSLFGTSALVFAARCAGAAAGLLTQLVLARTIGSEQLGIVYIALAVASVGAVIAAAGYPSVTVRFVRRYLTRGAPDRATQFIRSSRRDAAVLVFGLGILAALAVWLAPISDALRWPLILGVAMAPAFVLLSLNGGLANALRRVDISYLPDVFGRPLLWLGGLAVLLAAGVSLTASIVMAAALFAAFLAVALQWIAVSRVTGSLVSRSIDQGDGHAPRRITARWRSAAAPMIAIALFTNLIFDIDALMLGALMAPADLAVFGIAFKLALFVAFGVHVAQQTALPDIADASTARDRIAMRVAVERCVYLGTAGSLAALVVLTAAGQDLLALFGGEFAGGYGALVVLALCPVIRAAAGPAAQVLVLAGRQNLNLAVYAAGFAILVVLNGLLVGPFGITGAAVAMALTTLFWSGTLAVLAWRVTGVRTDGFCLPTTWSAGRGAVTAREI